MVLADTAQPAGEAEATEREARSQSAKGQL